MRLWPAAMAPSTEPRLAARAGLWQQQWSEKKEARIAERLKALPHLDESERILLARSLAATPDERWRLSQQFLRSLGLSRLFERKKFGFKSPE